MIDIDHFKNVNDTYGHQKGDEILLDFASTMKTFCCSNDVAARYGGEEFVLVLPETKCTILLSESGKKWPVRLFSTKVNKLSKHS